MIDISKNVHEKYCLSLKDIEAFEKIFGQIPQNSFVVIHTGWGKRWRSPAKYRNNLVFPTISKESARLFLKREVAGIGIDTLSPDRPENGYPVHTEILGAGKYIIENIANAEIMPATGAYSAALPIKIVKGTEAPVRLIAFVEDKAKSL